VKRGGLPGVDVFAYLPEALHRRGELEDTYERLLTELSWHLDPLEHDPWPHHATISGASLGVTRTAYCRVGRLPRVEVSQAAPAPPDRTNGRQLLTPADMTVTIRQAPFRLTAEVCRV
jgi:hypothetical protein